MSAALSGVRVVELSGADSYATPYGARLLADLGAEVILVESSAGHPLRHGHLDRYDDKVVGEMFDFLSSGKSSVMRTAGDDEQLAALLRNADIVIDALDDAGRAELGFGADLIAAARSAAAYVRVTPWGEAGPYAGRPATGLTLQAAAGWVTRRQDPDIDPLQVGGQMSEWIAGSFIAVAALTTRRQAITYGAPASSDFSVFACIQSTTPYLHLQHQTNLELGWSNTVTRFSPFGVRQCQDGWVGINILTGQQWEDACLMTDLPDFIGEQQALGRGESDPVGFTERLNAWLAERTVDEVVELGQAFRIPVVPVGNGATTTTMRQWAERPFFEEASGTGGFYTRPGAPWRLSTTPARRHVGAPQCGEHRPSLSGDVEKESVQ